MVAFFLISWNVSYLTGLVLLGAVPKYNPMDAEGTTRSTFEHPNL